MEEKLIIVNKTDLPMFDVMIMASQVVGLRRISGDSYCYATTFDGGIACIAKKNKKSDTLTFIKDGSLGDDED